MERKLENFVTIDGIPVDYNRIKLLSLKFFVIDYRNEK